MNPSVESFPVLGVGASLSFGIRPDPVELVDMNGGPSFIEYAGAVQSDLYASRIERLRQKNVPVLYHPSCMNLCGPWPNDPQWLRAIGDHVRAVNSPWLAQDVAICYAGERPGYSIQLGYFIAPILTEASLEQAVRRVSEVRAVVNAPLLLEPPPATFRLGKMSIFDWLGQLAERTDCGLLLDAGHVLSHQLIEGERGLDRLPLDRVVEVHVAGGILTNRNQRRYFVDAHDLPIQPETWEVFDDLLSVCPNLKAVCLECEGTAAAMILPVLEQVRQHVNLEASSEELRAKVRGHGIEERTLPEPMILDTRTTAPESKEPPGAGYLELLRLLFDPELREKFERGDPDLSTELDLPEDLLASVDPHGLAIDAEGRRNYLMSALCRTHPRSAGLLGALPEGPENLSRFLASRHIFDTLEKRNRAFGLHLQHLLKLAELDERERNFAGAFLEFESGLLQCAAQLRQAVHQGAPTPTIREYSEIEKQRGRLTLAPFTVLVELPHSPQVLEAAMHQLGPENAWSKISTGSLELDRIRAILRAEANPVTIICRGIASGMRSERAGAGGISPILEVSWRTAELRGRQARKIASLANERCTELPNRTRNLAEKLVDAGVLELQ